MPCLQDVSRLDLVAGRDRLDDFGGILHALALGRLARQRTGLTHSCFGSNLSRRKSFSTSRPSHWMNALFDGGPYADDVGRCVPGPPPADTFDVDGVTYYLRTVDR